MFPFLKRRVRDRGWLAWPTVSALGSRRALLLSPRQFGREVARERVRSTRRSIPFCILTVEMQYAEAAVLAARSRSTAPSAKVRLGRRASVLKKESRQLVDLLHRNLRMTDEKGVLSATQFGVLLVDTPEMGGRAVLDRMTQLLSAADLHVQLNLEVYDPEGFGDNEENAIVSSGGSENRRGDDNNDGDWGRRLSGTVQTATAVLQQTTLHSDAAMASPIHVPGEPSDASTLVHRQPLTATRVDGGVESRVSIASEDSTYHRPLAARVVKRTVDIVGACVGLVLTGPFIAASMIVIKWTDGGPALFCQTREGLHGRPFTIYKLRSMVVDAEKSQAALRAASHRDGPAFKISRDPRVTKVGHFLRATCLDELPQLINVLKGDMSLVGPRPLPWHESRACERWHRRRLDVRPGLTCIWQIDKSKAETFDDWMRMDLQYIDRLGFFKDLQLIARTVVVPVTGRGGD
ncbi:sugar transferase [Aporhodopirellula aestuarii]|uniref:Sugar transferase n=1 Tax=Aporhodopirellula aestuarii TaxID=2950107 RepID=A0ABT0U2U8_9BACT|nr:sugar transferase [Aporhodopirellula aestuarii]MCM2371225.1 sugar transferase [Aporhodopirellula aestuarii]